MSEPNLRGVPFHYNQLEFENGQLVKFRGQRPEYMDGTLLIRLVCILAKLLKEEKDKNEPG